MLGSEKNHPETVAPASSTTFIGTFLLEWHSAYWLGWFFPISNIEICVDRDRCLFKISVCSSSNICTCKYTCQRFSFHIFSHIYHPTKTLSDHDTSSVAKIFHELSRGPKKRTKYNSLKLPETVGVAEYRQKLDNLISLCWISNIYI